jgi:hypothetical protein
MYYVLCEASSWRLIDESKKVLGILYRAMKPVLVNFNPEMTCIYDERLKGILHDQYLQHASEIKARYGAVFLKFRVLMIRYWDVQSHDRTWCYDPGLLWLTQLDPNGVRDILWLSSP